MTSPRRRSPRWASYSFVASLGSERSATDAATRWVAEEIDLLRAAIAAEVPVLGLCFGGQALSIALGGEVGPRRAAADRLVRALRRGRGVPRGPGFTGTTSS